MRTILDTESMQLSSDKRLIPLSHTLSSISPWSGSLLQAPFTTLTNFFRTVCCVFHSRHFRFLISLTTLRTSYEIQMHYNIPSKYLLPLKFRHSVNRCRMHSSQKFLYRSQTFTYSPHRFTHSTFSILQILLGLTKGNM